MREIPLTGGLVAVVDDADYEALSAHRWGAQKSLRTFYARRGMGKKTVYMHRVVLNAPEGMKVDHISGDGLDNRRGNMRLATNAQNLHNHGPNKNNKHGYKGVTWHRAAKRWIASIQANGLSRYLGYFDSPSDAHAAYCAAAKELHGEFARTA